MADDTTSLYVAMAAALTATGDRIAIVDDSHAMSGAALLDGAERWAAGLAALGVGAGDRVAVQAEKSLDLVQLYLATLRLGAVLPAAQQRVPACRDRLFPHRREPGAVRVRSVAGSAVRR